MRYCIIKACDKQSHKKNVCPMHEWRIRKYGSPHLLKFARHGDCRSSEHSTWAAMRYRCLSPNSSCYKYYGGRGIKVCSRWGGTYGYHNFLKDMGKKPSPKHSIDRIDNNKGYTPSNCRWATQREQMCNRTNSNEVVGVGYAKQCGKWEAKLTIDGVAVLRKMFKNKEDAIKARLEAEVKYSSK